MWTEKRLREECSDGAGSCEVGVVKGGIKERTWMLLFLAES